MYATAQAQAPLSIHLKILLAGFVPAGSYPGDKTHELRARNNVSKGGINLPPYAICRRIATHIGKLGTSMPPEFWIP